MYLEEKLERLDKRIDTLERLTEERLTDLEESAEDNHKFIINSNSGTLEALMDICKQIEELSKRVAVLETPSLFPAEAAKQ